MPATKSGAKSAEKWNRNAQAGTQSYAEGVQAPRKSWAAATSAAAANHAAGVQAAIANKSFEKGVARAGDAKYQRGAIEKGTARYGPGVAAAQGDYQQAVEPYLQVIASTQLPARGPKGSPANIQRVAVLAAALNKAKVSRK